MSKDKIGRNKPCPCGKLNSSGNAVKYKYCCINNKEKSLRTITVTRADFISEPYKNCPNPSCLTKDTFGVFTPMGESKRYTRECVKCGYEKEFPLPAIKKKILYLDQFVISNLIKLLDKSHPSHSKVAADPFWETLFIKLEAASRSQAIVCPDSFYHVNESLTGGIDFMLMKRLYEHFSNGKTLYPGDVIQKRQIIQHFKAWAQKKKVEFKFQPEEIAFERDLHSWSVGLRISVGGNPYPGQIESLRTVNASTKEQLKNVWGRWQEEKSFRFEERVNEETLGMGKGIIKAAKTFMDRRVAAMTMIATGQEYNMDLDDFMPPMAVELLEEMKTILLKEGISGQKTAEIIYNYFQDVDSLLEIPKIKITTVMFAGLARRAALGKKNPPKSTADVEFISSYLPYCDALFVDKESASLLKELPQNTPHELRLKEFRAKIFTLNNKEDFLSYLDQLIADIPHEQITILKDIEGDDYCKPYWKIIEHEKSKK
jgi:Zn ribbon nucleic-acid-binding protein